MAARSTGVTTPVQPAQHRRTRNINRGVPQRHSPSRASMHLTCNCLGDLWRSSTRPYLYRGTKRSGSSSMASLSMLPNLTLESNDLQFCNALSLLLLSHTWCMAEQYAKSSLRWCALARFIVDYHQDDRGHESIYACELRSR